LDITNKTKATELYISDKSHNRGRLDSEALDKIPNSS
jgi:hypothetical protein